MFFHHAHGWEELTAVLGDFPEARILVTTRDPRANLVSGVEHWRQYSRAHDNAAHLQFYIDRILRDVRPADGRGAGTLAVRLEDLPKPETLRRLASWMGVSYRPSLLVATWADLEWHGDRISPVPRNPRGDTSTRHNGWDRRLSRLDRYLLHYVLWPRLKHYNYEHRPLRWWDHLLMRVVVWCPLSYERRFASWSYLRQEWRSGDLGRRLTALALPVYYWRRVSTFRAFARQTRRGEPFEGAWLRPGPS